MDSLFKKHPATTFVEILVYFVILALTVMVAMNFAVEIGDLYGSSTNNNEIQSNIDLLSSRFAYAVETATGINAGASSFDVDEGRLSLTMSDPAQSPTVFYLQDGVVYLQEGAAAAVPLTTPVVSVNYFRLNEITATKAPAQILLDAAISIANIDRQQMATTRSLHLAITLRQ